MDAKILRTIVNQIHRRFPEFAGVQPKVQTQRMGEGREAQAKSAAPTVLLTFHSSNKTRDGAQSKTISRWVRVVVNEQGKILKITTSR
jgi:hypothetical protein